MDLETLPVYILLIAFFALTSWGILPVPAGAAAGKSDRVSAYGKDSPGGSACDLPPLLSDDLKGKNRVDPGAPPLDSKVPEKFKTATFAMG